MKKLNSLPLLDKLLSLAPSLNLPNLDNIIVVCVQHVITTTVNLFEALISLGIKPNNMFILGKQYSTSEKVHKSMIKLGINMQSLTALNLNGTYESIFRGDINKMWENVKNHVNNNHVQGIIVLDDGGRCLECIPEDLMSNFPIVGIEQTTAGLFNPKVLALPIPFIDVATSAAKKCLESKIISEEIIQSVEKYVLKNKKNRICGVVGLGTIGKALADRLTSLGFQVIVYDQHQDVSQKKGTWCESLLSLIERADFIFGCTGRDVTQGWDLSLIKKDKVFISCSSEDKEFFSLLSLIPNNTNQDPFSDLKYYTKHGATIRILNGGFPINFNRRKECSHPKNIQLTRGLLLGALLQAINHLVCNNKVTGRIMLSPEIQKIIVSTLSKFSDFWSAEIINFFSGTTWIVNNSNGKYMQFSDIFLNFLPEHSKFQESNSVFYNDWQIPYINFMQLSNQF